ncbi:MAG: aminoglycoside phosphotransferase family protein [Chloroflexota bacterium]
MNMILSYLQDNRQRLELETYHIPQNLTSVMMTPRFRASSHVVYLIMPKTQVDPVLVAKVPRLSGASATVAREVRNLRAVQASRPGGFDTIPRIIAFEPHKGHELLVETALVGTPMSPEIVRENPDRCCTRMVDWLLELQQPSIKKINIETDWCKRLIEQPLAYFETALPRTEWETHLIRETRLLTGLLCDAELPMVFEHGDLSHPNIFLLKNGRVGVVDWELAEPHGLVGYDLFFFLTYIAFAKAGASTAHEYQAAFQQAFFGPDAWTKPYIRRYAAHFDLGSEQLTALFVLSWARYLSNLLLRLEENRPSGKQVDENTAAWLRTNRYYSLWQYAVNNADQLTWGGLTRRKKLKLMTKN